MTPSERALAGRMGALLVHARGRTNAAPAGEALQARLEAEVDADRVLEPEERHRRAAFLRRARMQELALASARARRKAKAA